MTAKKIAKSVLVVILLIVAAIFGDKIDISKDIAAVAEGDVKYAAEQVENAPNEDAAKPKLDFEGDVEAPPAD